MGAFPQKWTDDQVLSILRASHADYPGVARAMGMSPNYAKKYRESGSVRGMKLRDKHGLSGTTQWKFHHQHNGADERRMIARIQAGDE